jgi:hypothetical protein
MTMTTSQMNTPMQPPKILQGAIVSGLINAVINGAIQFFLMRASSSIPLTVNEIVNDRHTVLGAAVPLAVSLAMILTVVAYTTIKTPKRPFFPSVFWLTIKHGIFAFGLVVAGAVVWQRFMGEIEVSLAVAVLLLGVIAGIAAGIVNYMTMKASLISSKA